MKSSIFQDATESTTRTIGRHDVRVVFRGGDAKTDGRTVVLPALPANADVNPVQAAIMRGYRDHETLHLRCTDTSPSIMRQKQTITEMEHTVFEFTEDIRIEHAGLTEYSGMRENLLALQRKCGEMTLANVEKAIPIEQFCVAPRKLQFQIVYQAIARKSLGLGTDEYDKLITHADPAVVKFCEKWATEVLKLPLGLDKYSRIVEKDSKQGTHDALNLSKVVAAAWEKEIESQPRMMMPPPKGSDAIKDMMKDMDTPPDQQGEPGEGSGKPGKDKPEKDAKPKEKESKDEKPDDQQDNQPEQQPADQADDDAGDDGDVDGDAGGQASDDSGDEGDDAGDGGGEGDDDTDDQGDDDVDDGSSGGDADDDTDDDGDDDADDGGSGGGDDDDSDSDIDVSPGGGSGDGQGGGGGGGDSDADDGGGQGEAGDGAGGGGAGIANNNSGVQINLAALDAALAAMGDIGADQKDALSDVVKEIVDPDGGGSGATDRWHPFSRELEIETDVLEYLKGRGSKEDEALQQGDRVYLAARDAIKDKQAMIRRVLELELQARADRKWQSGKKSGRLDQVRIVSAIQGAENVYRKREDGKAMDSLLHIAVDGSGSMSGGRMRSAMLLGIALSDALERTGCDISIDVWGDYYPSNIPGARGVELKEIQQRVYNDFRDANHGEFSSIGSVENIVIKKVTDRMTSAVSRSRIGLMPSTVHGGTPGWEALFSAIRRVGACKQSKKVLLFITDGEFGHGRQPAWSRDAVALARSLDVHMIGVGIGGMDVSDIFSDSVTVDTTEMYEAVMKRLAKYIAQEKTGVMRAA